MGDLADDGEVVGDEQVGDAEVALQLDEQLEDLGLHGDVERRDRLVADDELGLDRQRAGDGDALALAAGQLGRLALQRRRRQGDAVEQLGGTGAPAAPVADAGRRSAGR